MIEIRSPFHYDPASFKGEVNDEESLTVPDQAISVKEILEFSRSGIDIGINTRRGLYDDDLGSSDIDDYEPLEINDIFEAHELKLQNELEAQQQAAQAASQAKQDEQPPLPMEEQE